MNYLINADGIIVDGWIGFDAKTSKIETALSKLDPKLGQGLLDK